MIIGDLPIYIELQELEDYHIFTYHFGDVFRLYLRGQFTAHQNSPLVNYLWAKCAHLGAHLQKELEAKHEIVRKLAAKGKRGRTRFISAEGCYSFVVASTPGLRVKFASKAFADWSGDRYFYVIDGAVRKCLQPEHVWKPNTTGQPCQPFGPRLIGHSAALPGVQRPHGDALSLQTHSNCSRWIQKPWRLCAALTEAEAPLYNVMLHEGRWWAQRFVSRVPQGNLKVVTFLEGAFLHLQQWKGRFRKLKYGGASIPRLQMRRVFLLSSKAFEPLDMKYGEHARGLVQ